ncbi:tRNA-(ms[2]io[6]A)-hydroxylase [Alkalimonas sp.]|uniref:tRNA isopentenyl-2-thiomethyl-A-37 hydroxylase MiaE n=1 Tax=Alkalimonas sp. TaxID=1872453 RepID=UPI00263BA51D|nr:tRNA isopentenyl-2-thiomethyl-A-37 hydroxylase MiaE [Alkalimonas sp.]MCC5824963.1 tRNA-(ms[2]io[6]A)-hydroxylase [Alkalimonas sp.]
MNTAELADLLAPIHQFLHCRTPNAWLEQAALPDQLPALLIDHMHCELKAAQSAALLIRRYATDDESARALLSWLRPYEDFVYRKVGDGNFSQSKNTLIGQLTAKGTSPWQQQVLEKMVRLIKEELHHFEQVLAFIRQRGIEMQPLSAAGYASGLLRHVRSRDPGLLVDKLIIGALIEARSCERFAALAPLLDDDLQRFYISLLRSEARHYQDYLQLAADISPEPIAQRVQQLAAIEAELILQPAAEFRFHSGVPAAA